MPLLGRAPHPPPTRMTALERRASFNLALIFALRMLGLFLLCCPCLRWRRANLPRRRRSRAGPGLAMGIYGLRAVLQLPWAWPPAWGANASSSPGCWCSPRAAWLAALADWIWSWAARCRAPGAVSAAVTALLQPTRRATPCHQGHGAGGRQHRADVRHRAGGGASCLAAAVGLPGLFGLTCALALAGVAIVLWVVPPEPARHADTPRGRLADLWRHGDLLRLNLGVFVLHTVQMAMWVAVPAMLVQAGLARRAPACVPACGGAVFPGHGRAVCHGTARAPARRAAGCHRTGAAGAGGPGADGQPPASRPRWPGWRW